MRNSYINLTSVECKDIYPELIYLNFIDINLINVEYKYKILRECLTELIFINLINVECKDDFSISLEL